jgi:arabinogalactan endo-1,4-beta-galactosidase
MKVGVVRKYGIVGLAKIACAFGLFALFVSCAKVNNLPPPAPEPTFYRAADLSFLPQIRADQSGFNTYYNADSAAQDALDIFKDAGCNTVRLRVWHSPSTMHSSLTEVENFANEIKAKGMKVWLTVHYSDWWADPGHQTPPAAWDGLDVNTLADSVYQYSYRVAQRIKPEIFQVGNEINNGFLWPTGHANNPPNFHKLLAAGSRAVRDASPDSKIMLQYAGIENAKLFYSWLDTVDYDQIGLSYYPKWHNKDMNQLAASVYELGDSFDKEILWAELAYPFTLGWNDWTNNIVGGPTDLIEGYPATPQGQHALMMMLRSIISNTNQGSGFCYWAPEWIAYRGPQAQDGSPWENQALFNFNNKALPAMQMYNE